MPEPIRMPPRHPYAVAHINNREYPALVLEWVKVMDANGYLHLNARIAYAVDGKAVTTLLPASQVRQAP